MMTTHGSYCVSDEDASLDKRVLGGSLTILGGKRTSSLATTVPEPGSSCGLESLGYLNPTILRPHPRQHLDT